MRRFVLGSCLWTRFGPRFRLWSFKRMRCRLIQRMRLRLRLRLRLCLPRPLRLVLLFGPRRMVRGIMSGVIDERPRGAPLRCQRRMRLCRLRSRWIVPFLSRHILSHVSSRRAL